jgi:hypothetical protein
MALTFDPCKPLKTRRGGRGSKLTLFDTLTNVLSLLFLLLGFSLSESGRDRGSVSLRSLGVG